MNLWKVLKVVGFIVGVVLLYYWLKQLGFANIGHALLDIRAWFLAVIVNALLWNVTYTQAWRGYFSNLEHRIPFWHLYKIKICGEAVNLMTPLGFMGGDSVRVVLLRRHLGTSSRLGSVIVDRILHIAATASFVMAGLLFTFTQSLTLSVTLRSLMASVYFIIFSFLIFLLTELIRGHGFMRVYAFLNRFNSRKLIVKLQNYLLNLHEELSNFGNRSLGPLVKGYILHLLGRVLGGLEISIILYAFTGEFHLLLGMMLAALTAMTLLLFAFIPGGFGVVETMYAQFFQIYGLDPVLGVSTQLLRRIRGLALIFIGLALIHFEKRVVTKN